MNVADIVPDAETQARLEQVAKRYGVASIKVYGSVARGEATPDSDLDLLVTFEEGRHPGWLVFDLQRELSDLLGKNVDLTTDAMWRGSLRAKVLREAEAVYG